MKKREFTTKDKILKITNKNFLKLIKYINRNTQVQKTPRKKLCLGIL